MPGNETKGPPRVYLDVCAIQRPADDQRQARVRAEAEAIAAVLDLSGAGLLTLLGSTVHVIETARTANIWRRERMRAYLARAAWIELDEVAAASAQRLLDYRLRPMDALHLASAVRGGADYMCTCDDQFLRRARTIPGLTLRVVSPLELVVEVSP